jgi:hypothetical protein
MKDGLKKGKREARGTGEVEGLPESGLRVKICHSPDSVIPRAKSRRCHVIGMPPPDGRFLWSVIMLIVVRTRQPVF